jgi:hypothetical protein
MWEWFMGFSPNMQLVIVAGALDIIAGALPDRFAGWPGIILSFAKHLQEFGVQSVKAEPGEVVLTPISSDKEFQHMKRVLLATARAVNELQNKNDIEKDTRC